MNIVRPVGGYQIRIVSDDPEAVEKIRKERTLFKRRLAYKKNRERVRQYFKKWREEHKDYERQRKRIWDAANRKRINERWRKRYHMRRELSA